MQLHEKYTKIPSSFSWTSRPKFRLVVAHFFALETFFSFSYIMSIFNYEKTNKWITMKVWRWNKKNSLNPKPSIHDLFSFVQDHQKEKGLKIWKLLGWLCEHFLKNDKKKIESDFHADFFFLHAKHFHVWFSWCENFFFPYYYPPFCCRDQDEKSDKNYKKKKQKTLAKHYALIV